MTETVNEKQSGLGHDHVNGQGHDYFLTEIAALPGEFNPCENIKGIGMGPPFTLYCNIAFNAFAKGFLKGKCIVKAVMV